MGGWECVVGGWVMGGRIVSVCVMCVYSCMDEWVCYMQVFGLECVMGGVC